MEKGKQKCEKLKSIRKAFADANGVDYTPSECSSTDECSGTCPKCEAEAEYIMSKIKEENSATNTISVNAEDLSENISHEDKNDITDHSVGEDVVYVDVDMGDIDLPLDDILLTDGDIPLMIDVDNGDIVKDELCDIYVIDDNIEDYKQNK